MADEAPEVETPAIVRRRWPWPLRWLGGLVALLLVMAGAIGFGIDTDAGHRFIVDRIGELKPSSGLRIHIGRIDGSIWRHAHIHDLRLSDPQGLFLEAPSVQLHWRPGRWLANRLHVDSLSSDLVILHRLPKLRPAPEGTPIIPDYRIHIGKLDLRLRLDPGVAGEQRRFVRLVGQADTGVGRAVIGVKATSSAGDRLRLALDTEPDRDVFDLDARLTSPVGGVVPGLLGSKRPIAMLVDGQGVWTGWHGRARLDVAGQHIADLRLTEARDRYALAGRITPASIAPGKMKLLAGAVVRVEGAAHIVDRRIDGMLKLASPALTMGAKGMIDLAHGSFDPLKIDVALLQPTALVPTMTGQQIRLHAELSGAFRHAGFRYALTAPQFAFGPTGFEGVQAEGAGHLGGDALTLPIKLSARRVTGVGDVAGGILANLSVEGVLKVTPKLLTGDGLTLRSDKLSGKLALLVDLVGGGYSAGLSGGFQRYLIPGLGIVDVLTELKVLPGPGGKGTIVQGHGKAWVRRFDNVFLNSLTGGLPTLDTEMTRTADGIVHFSNLKITAPWMALTGSGTRQKDGSLQIVASGTQKNYGPFKMTLDGMIDHPKIGLLLDHPVDALGLAVVRVDLDPLAQGFTMKVAGGSTLGGFTGTGSILTPPGAPATIIVDGLNVSGTTAKGTLRADPGGLSGQLAVAGGGIGGTIDLAPAGTLQHVAIHLIGDHANLAGDAGFNVRRGKVDADLLLDPAGTHLDATVSAQGLHRGALTLAQIAAHAKLVGGNGELIASVSGSRGRAFALQTDTRISADSYAVRGQGTIDGRPVALTAPALLRHVGESWVLSPASLTFAGGSATVAGHFGNQATAFEASLDAMPLSVLDMLKPGLGLSGEATGRLDYGISAPGVLPTGHADLRVRGLSRAGLILSSRPVDLGLTAVLTGSGAAMRAIAESGGQVIGRAQARLSPLATTGMLADRLLHAPLFAQLRYNGPIDTLWRLTGIETIDLSGPVAIGADIGGTLHDPQIRGSLGTSAARIESATTGTVIDTIKAAGRFDGSRLLIDQFSGATKDNGSVSGHAAFDFAGAHGLGMDIALDAHHAQLLARDDIGATITGPLVIKSDGHGGKISGSVVLDKSSYNFGKAAAQGVPHLAVREVNRIDEDEGSAAPLVPWALDLTTDAHGGMLVRGLGLDSEWRAKLAIKGSVDNPSIVGRADLVRGNYEFAGRRFDLDRGIIRFAGETPADPALDIVAKASVQGVSASIQVSGTGTKPEISFTSTPALPEDELLSRLLFGTSIANLSAPEALQLASAVNGLRDGGSGSLDPINAVRRVAHLDRLRVEPADITTGQKTSIAAGKYIGKKIYVELVTDGQGYSATRGEFQVTRWLTLLSTISTIGRQSVSIRVSKDY